MTHADQTQTKSRRPLPLFLIALGVLVVLATLAVVVIMMVPIKPHFPPESEEKIAKRLSTKNGFYALQKATVMIQEVRFAHKLEITPAQMWRIDWPADPETEKKLLDYLGDVEPALSELRGGLKAEFYLLSENYASPGNEFRSRRAIAGHLAIQAKSYEAEGKFHEAMENYLTVVRLGKMVGSDGGMYQGWIGSEVERVGLEAMNLSLHKYDDPEILRHALSSLEEMKNKTSLAKNFEYDLRQWEASVLEDPENAVSGVGGTLSQLNPLAHMPVITPALDALLTRYHALRFNWNIAEVHADIVEALDAPYHEFQKRKGGLPKDRMVRAVTSNIEWIVLEVAEVELLLNRTRVEIATRLYVLHTGTYPDSNDLVPDYLETVPLNPLTGQPLLR